jgi:WD40 repeat protein
LVERLLADCEGESGALPLLSTALAELWRERDGRHLRLAGYERTAGVRGAVARLAEEAYGRLDPEQRAVARRILLRLAGDEVQGVPVGRRVPLAELDDLRDDDVRRVLDVLADGRLLTVSAGSVEVAHEALLRAWPRLRGWLEEDAEGRRVHRGLRQAATAWSDGDRDPGELYRGARLASALEWRAVHEPELTATEQHFLEAGRVASVRARRRLRFVLLGVAALLVMTTGAALIALEQRERARGEALAAEAQRLGAQALTEEPLDRSLLMARQGVALHDTPATRDSLLAVLRRSPAAVGFIGVAGGAPGEIALHPDGRTLAVGADGGRVVFVDAVSRRALGRPHQLVGASRISSLAFSPDGTRLAAAAGGDERSSRVLDLFDGRRRRHIVQVQYESDSAPARVYFSPDSRVLAAQGQGGDRKSGQVWRWDARTGARWAPSGGGPRFGGSSTLLGLIGAPARVVTSGAREGGTAIRDPTSLRPLRRFRASGPVAALSPAAGLVALGGGAGAVRMLDLRSGELRTARTRAAAPLVALGFDPRGTRLVTAHRDGRLILWDARRLEALETLDARGAGPMRGLQLSPDGRTAYTTGGGGRIVVWDLAGGRRWEQPFATGLRPSTPHALTVSDAGSRAAVIDARGFATLLDGRPLRPSGRIGRRPDASAGRRCPRTGGRSP